MRCKSCQYPLWRLKARQCPECGTAFSPGEFDFVPYSVKFLCPHCEQEYYGDGPRGHLHPAEFECVKCARPVGMHEMVVEPAAGVEETQTQTRKVPWLERKSRGFLRAWFQTVGMALIAPGELMQALPRDTRTGTAVWFMVVTQAIIWLVAAVPIWALVGVQMVTMATGRGGTAIGPLAGGLLAIFGIGFLITLLAWLVFTLSAHAVLCLTGRRSAGLGRTMQAFSFASAANVLTAIPCLGAYIGWIWWVVSATLMVREGQRVSGWRAVLAVVAPVAVSLALLLGAYAYFVYWAINTAQTAMAAANAAAVGTEIPSLQRIGSAMCAHAGERGAWPAHGALLIQERRVGSDDFVGGDEGWSATLLDEVDVGPVSLEAFDQQTAEEQGTTGDVAAAAIPPGTAAHRVGDVVICVAPNDPVNLPGAAWLAVGWPHPDVVGYSAPTLIHAVQVDGTVTPIPAFMFDAELVRQNTLRAASGLPPLPHPKDVK